MTFCHIFYKNLAARMNQTVSMAGKYVNAFGLIAQKAYHCTMNCWPTIPCSPIFLQCFFQTTFFMKNDRLFQNFRFFLSGEEYNCRKVI